MSGNFWLVFLLPSKAFKCNSWSTNKIQCNFTTFHCFVKLIVKKQYTHFGLSYLTTAFMIRHMVRRVIAISGSPLADWAVFNDKFRAMNTRLDQLNMAFLLWKHARWWIFCLVLFSLVFGERIGCTIESSWKLVDCVKRGRYQFRGIPVYIQ
jgi:hypothetical protein